MWDSALATRIDALYKAGGAGMSFQWRTGVLWDVATATLDQTPGSPDITLKTRVEKRNGLALINTMRSMSTRRSKLPRRQAATLLKNQLAALKWKHGPNGIFDYYTAARNFLAQLKALGRAIPEWDQEQAMREHLRKSHPNLEVAARSLDAQETVPAAPDVTLDEAERVFTHHALKIPMPTGHWAGSPATDNGQPTRALLNHPPFDPRQQQLRLDAHAFLQRNECRRCGKTGHWERDCTHPGGNKITPHVDQERRARMGFRGKHYRHPGFKHCHKCLREHSGQKQKVRHEWIDCDDNPANAGRQPHGAAARKKWRKIHGEGTQNPALALQTRLEQAEAAHKQLQKQVAQLLNTKRDQDE